MITTNSSNQGGNNMLKLIVGVKGSGKTKTLIEMVGAALDGTDGAVICIEKGDKLRYDVKYQCRLINTEEYNINSAQSLYGFVAGLFASNHDITDLFIDSALKICEDDISAFEKFIDEMNYLCEKFEVRCVITSSIDIKDLSDDLKKYTV